MHALNVIFFICLGAYVGRFMAITTHFLPIILLEGCDKGREPKDIIRWFFQKQWCWSCQAPISSILNLPIVGYFLSNGRCSKCHQCIEKKCILLELGMACLFALSIVFYPISLSLLFVLIASCLLISCFITDFEHGILPDQLTLTLLWVGLIASLEPVFVTPSEAILGAIAGYGILWGINFIYRIFRDFDGMFPGDFKLNAALGACVGFKILIPILILSMVLLIITTVIKVLWSAKSADTSHLYSDILYKEVPYACFVSVTAVPALYLILFRFS